MNLQRKFLIAGSLASALTLAGCWGDDDDNDATAPPVAAAEVPDSAVVSTASFVAFILSLAGNDETSEPLLLRDTQAVPADETGEPTPLT